jgi:hypothetical protein
MDPRESRIRVRAGTAYERVEITRLILREEPDKRKEVVFARVR